MTTETKTPELTQNEKEQSAAIMHAVNMDSNFKLYSYRIIDHATFISRTKELIALFKSNCK